MSTSLRQAAEAFLNAIDNMTSDRFEVGADQPEREALREALAEKPEAGGEWRMEQRNRDQWGIIRTKKLGEADSVDVTVAWASKRDAARIVAAVNREPAVRKLVEAAEKARTWIHEVGQGEGRGTVHADLAAAIKAVRDGM